MHPTLPLASAALLGAVVLAGCQKGDSKISDKDAKAQLSDRYFVIEKKPVTFNHDDGLWYVSGTDQLAEGVAWVPDTDGNVDDYLPNPQDRPEHKPQPDRVGYIRHFNHGRQQGPVVELTAEGAPNKVFYYHDNSMEWRFRFDNQEDYALKEIIELTEGHADGRLQLFYPNGQQAVIAAMHTLWQDGHPKGGPDYRAGRWQEWAPNGDLLMDVDFDPADGQMITIREMASGFRLYWNYKKDAEGNPTPEKEFFEVMLRGINGGYPVKPGTQAERWLLARAPENPLPDIPLTPEGRAAIAVEEEDIHQPMPTLRLPQVPAPGPSPTAAQEAAGLPAADPDPAPAPAPAADPAPAEPEA